MKRICALLVLLLFLVPAAMAQEEIVALRINGEAVYQAEVDASVASLTESMAQMGLDTTDADILSAIESVALRQIIEDRLLTQDMTAQGMYDFTEEEEGELAAAAQEALDALLADYTDYFAQQSDSQDAAQEAQAALEAAGYTVVLFENHLRNVAASERYEAWLTADEPAITSDEVQQAYQQRVADSESLYAQDVAAFETAMASGEEVWYRPAGYRALLHIMLSAQGETEEEKLQSVRETTDAIYARLEAGASFESLMAEYSEDTDFEDPDFQGYQVNEQSVLWEDAFVQAAFSDELAQPGDVSQPVVFGENVHILYYLEDVEAGAVPLTDELAQALASELDYERADTLLQERLAELEQAAQIVYEQEQ